MASMSKLNLILSSGARDLRVPTLQEQSQTFFELMAGLMELQEKKTPPPLAGADLCELRSSIDEALQQLLGSEVPDTLGHLDCNPGNVVSSKNACTFLDWAEAVVGNPFLTFQYLLEYFRQAFPNNPGAEMALSSAYLAPWDALLDPCEVRKTMGVAPALAAYAQGVALVARRRHRLPSDPALARSLRGLTRRLHREIENWRTSRARSS